MRRLINHYSVFYLSISFLIINIFYFDLFAEANKHDYRDALHKAVYFYGAQRCGDTKSWIHGPCHTRDGERDGIDLSGGWHDCGDHVKFGQTNSFTAALLLMTYNHFPVAFEDRYSQDYSKPPPNGIPDILDEVKIFTDYLLKACKNGKAYFQVAAGWDDHSTYCEPEHQSTLGPDDGGDPRKIYSVTKGASNFCGASAAALALMYLSYREFDSDYADKCLEKAKEYYEIGDAEHEAIFDAEKVFYKEEYWADDMAFGAIELYKATEEEKYLNAAENFHHLENFDMPTYFVMDWGNAAPAVCYDLYNETHIIRYYNNVMDEFRIMTDSTKETMEKYGYAYFGPDNEDNSGSLKYTAAAAMIALLHYDMRLNLNGKKKEEAYLFAQRNVDFILGSHDYLCADAPENFSFLIGYNKLGGGYPKYPHHCASFGRKGDAGDLWHNADVENKYELTGALVGGPKRPGGSYNDSRDDWDGNEPGIYYNAPLIGALAYLITHKEEFSIKNQIHFPSLKCGLPVSFKVAGDAVVNLPGDINPETRLNIYNFKGRLLGIITVGDRKMIDLQKALGKGYGMLIVRVKHELAE